MVPDRHRRACRWVPAPAMVAWATNEFVRGANPAVFMYLAGSQFAGILYDLGNAQQRRWAAMAIDRNWGATMVLTEPDAGSDVGAERTKAIEQPDGSWHIEGVKRWGCAPPAKPIAARRRSSPIRSAGSPTGSRRRRPRTPRSPTM